MPKGKPKGVRKYTKRRASVIEAKGHVRAHVGKCSNCGSSLVVVCDRKVAA